MNCREALAKLYDYLDRELGEEDKQHMERHLEYCSDCLKKYELEEEFNKVIREKVCCSPDVTHLKKRILEQIDKIDDSSQPRNILFLIAPILLAAAVALVIFIPSGKGSDPQTVLLAMRSFADEHTKCLDHLLKYFVESSDPIIVKAGASKYAELPDDLFVGTPAEINIKAAAVAHLPSGDDIQLDYNAFGEDVSVFVLPRGTIDKSPFERVERDGKAFYVGSCPYYQYIIWACEGHECVAVSKLPKEKLVDFAICF